MKLFSSIKTLGIIAREDAKLASLGACRGDLLRLHYGGRLAARRGEEPNLRRIVLRQFGRNIDVELSGAYCGAFKGIFLDQEYNCAKLLQVPVQRILDLGANIGMGAVHLACQFPEAEIACVEPDPRNLPLLDRNLNANAVRAQIISAAAGAEMGKLNLRFGDNPTCSALETSPMHELDETTSVDVVTVPAILEQLDWDYIDLLKIDVEGSEDELLSINNNWLSKVGALILEIHPNTTPDRIGNYIEAFGYRLRRVSHGREPVYFASR